MAVIRVRDAALVDLADSFTVEVKIAGYRRWMLRLWLGALLFRLGSMLIGNRLKIEYTDEG